MKEEYSFKFWRRSVKKSVHSGSYAVRGEGYDRHTIWLQCLVLSNVQSLRAPITIFTPSLAIFPPATILRPDHMCGVPEQVLLVKTTKSWQPLNTLHSWSPYPLPTPPRLEKEPDGQADPHTNDLVNPCNRSSRSKTIAKGVDLSYQKKQHLSSHHFRISNLTLLTLSTVIK